MLAALLAVAAQAPPHLGDARALAEQLVADGVTPSLAVAVLEDGRVWAEGFGFADRERGVAATADTPYRLASISKPFTATAVMRLVERGRLDLDAPVNDYLEAPGMTAFAGRARDVTLRRLLNHTSGLPTHWSFFYPGSTPPPRATTIARYGFTAWPPGTRTQYSNLAFGIADHVIARTSGTTYAAFLRDEVLAPLGMAHSGVGVPSGCEQVAATGYAADAGGRFVPVADYGFDHDGASAVWSSANDLMRFAAMHIGEGELDGTRVLGRETALAMREPRARDAGSSFAIGWSVGDVRGEPSLHHTGGMPGVSTVLHAFPRKRAAFCVLTNVSDRGATGRMRDALLDALIAPSPPPRGGGERPARPQPPTAKVEDGTWRGHLTHFDGPLPVTLTLAAGKPRLTVGSATTDSFLTAAVDRDSVRLRTPVRLRTSDAFHGTPTLDLALAADERGGWRGVGYADGDSTLRLPHWVQLAPQAEKPDDVVRVVTWNVLVGFADQDVDAPYLPGNQRRAAALTWLAAQRPDVVALQELNGFTEAGLRATAAAWGHPHVALLKEDGFPVGLTSRQPIEVVERRRDGLHHGLLHARSGGIDYVVVHVVPHPGVERKLREVEQALACARRAHSDGHPALVLGDFNCIAEGDVDRFGDAARERYRRWGWAEVDGRPSECALGPLLRDGLVDVVARQGGGGELPLPRIDFVLASMPLAEACRGATWHCDEEMLRWSDHPPVVADFARPGPR